MPPRLPPLPPAETLTFAHIAAYGLSVVGGCVRCRHGIQVARGGTTWTSYGDDPRPILELWGDALLECLKCSQPFDDISIDGTGGNLLFPHGHVARWSLGMGIPEGAAKGV